MERNLKPVSLKPLKQHFSQTHETPLLATLTTVKCPTITRHPPEAVCAACSILGWGHVATDGDPGSMRPADSAQRRARPKPSSALAISYPRVSDRCRRCHGGLGTPISETNNGHRWIGRSGVSPTYLRVISDCGGDGDISISMNVGWRWLVAWLRVVETLAFGVSEASCAAAARPHPGPYISSPAPALPSRLWHSE